MNRVIEILEVTDSCLNCRYRSHTSEEKYPPFGLKSITVLTEYCVKKEKLIGVGLPLEQLKTIPDWCPLPIVEEWNQNRTKAVSVEEILP